MCWKNISASPSYFSAPISGPRCSLEQFISAFVCDFCCPRNFSVPTSLFVFSSSVSTLRLCCSSSFFAHHTSPCFLQHSAGFTALQARSWKQITDCKMDKKKAKKAMKSFGSTKREEAQNQNCTTQQAMLHYEGTQKTTCATLPKQQLSEVRHLKHSTHMQEVLFDQNLLQDTHYIQGPTASQGHHVAICLPSETSPCNAKALLQASQGKPDVSKSPCWIPVSLTQALTIRWVGQHWWERTGHGTTSLEQPVCVCM